MSKVAVFIGRFQPFHDGHKTVINSALKSCDKILVLIGSANEPRTARNPFTFLERKQMIKNEFPNGNVLIEPVINHLYNDTAWSNQIRDVVKKWSNPKDEIYLVGFSKDHTSYYLNMFPEWKSINATPYYVNNKILDATTIRETLYKTYHSNWSWKELFPLGSIKVIGSVPMNIIDSLIEEHNFIKKYKQQWKDSPYPPIFVTTDAIVTQSGHIVMVKRGAQPGKGQLALPGGFIKEYEGIKDACVRELHEETKIDLPKPVLYGSIVNSRVFDSPYRSQRGRTITHAYHFELDSKKPFPKIKGSDDAEKAIWIPLNILERKYLFEDHACIIEYFTGVRIDQ